MFIIIIIIIIRGIYAVIIIYCGGLGLSERLQVKRVPVLSGDSIGLS